MDVETADGRVIGRIAFRAVEGVVEACGLEMIERQVLLDMGRNLR